MKIRTRLFITSILLFAAGSFWFVEWILDDFRYHYFMTMEESMVDTATVLSSIVSQHLTDDTLPLPDSLKNGLSLAAERTLSAQIYDFTKTNMDLRVLIIDSAGRVQFDSRNGDAEGEDYSQWRDVRLTLAGKYGARATAEDPDDPDSLTFYVGSPLISNGQIRGVLSVGKPIQSILPFIDKAKGRLIAAGATVISAVLLLQILISFWVTRPINMLTTYARAVRDGKATPRPKLPHSEMGDLAAAFEEMRDALEGRKYVEHYIQSLTHEMKSPLAAIRGASELLNEEMSEKQRRRFLQNICTETQRMHDLIDRLLALVGLEKRKGIEHAEIVNLSALVEEVLESFQPVIQNHAIHIDRAIDPTVQLTGEPFLLRQAAANLIQNALDFSTAGGSILVELSQEAGAATLRIVDDGPGIPDYAIGRVFERFYSLPRPDHGKKSSGLGLNVVREIAKLHGGEILLRNRAPHGVEAVLRLPAGSA